jgi:hypothetical protein
MKSSTSGSRPPLFGDSQKPGIQKLFLNGKMSFVTAYRSDEPSTFRPIVHVSQLLCNLCYLPRKKVYVLSLVNLILGSHPGYAYVSTYVCDVSPFSGYHIRSGKGLTCPTDRRYVSWLSLSLRSEGEPWNPFEIPIFFLNYCMRTTEINSLFG